MLYQETHSTIKSIVHSLIPDARVVLFGSRANGDFHEQSDYDILIITKQTMPPRQKSEWIGKIHKKLVYGLHAACDVLLNSEEEVVRKKNLPGHIVSWATREGIEI